MINMVQLIHRRNTKLKKDDWHNVEFRAKRMTKIIDDLEKLLHQTKDNSRYLEILVLIRKFTEIRRKYVTKYYERT